MLKNERENEIFQILSERKFITVKELSRMLYASESSIRRDLTSLEKKGMAKRSYGGAEIVLNTGNVAPFSQRALHNIDEKKHIARKVAALVSDNDIIFFDQSSSALFAANEIRNLKKNITVVTNNLEIAALFTSTDFEVHIAGGYLSPNNRNCILGSDAAASFKNFYADILFFSSRAISHDGIIYDCNREEICIRNTMLEYSKKKIFLCDTEKIGKNAGFRQCSLSDTDMLVTEKHPEDIPDSFKNMITVI
ncbi:MAG: DeoR/GlpR transcriptional regulator [Clostridia bacterium]|nr:DeoR/GlpR transcriptional regulator [Clostridia bacterium]